MQAQIVCQGRHLSGEDLSWLRDWVGSNPQWTRTRLARELCQQWDWRNGRGQIKNFAARSFLDKLEGRGLLSLPALRPINHPGRRWDERVEIDWPTDPISGTLGELEPLEWVMPKASQPEARRFNGYLKHYHYLGLRVVGENIQYVVRDRQGRDLAGLLFGAAAWRATARDQFIGWDQTQRAARLHYLTNNTRFLILPWVKVAGLASRVLSQAVMRLSGDWQSKYGHPIYLVESFVERGRFGGTCYRAANWLRVGQTLGRGRQGRNPMEPTEPIKDVYVYPLTGQFRRLLLGAA
jgi:uncharacterized protein DUF4338